MAHERFEKLSIDTTSASSSTPSSRRQNGFAAIPTSQTQHTSDVGESTIIDDDASDSTKEDDGALMMHGSLTRDSQMSKLREQLHQRGTSIKFDSVAKLDNGHVHALDTPLPRSAGADDDPNGEKETHNGHAAQPYYIPIKQRQRRHSETEKEEFDPVTGAPLDSGRNRRPYLEGELRYPLVQATVDELARERGYGAAPLAEPPSLTSERTASPVMEEVQTPVNGHLLSPLTVTASPIDFSPRRESGAFPSRRAVSQRSFGSLGSVGRRHTVKSNTSSLSSPARSFLSQWTNHDDTVREPDLDDEGQEIGDGSGYIIGRKIGYGGFSVIKECRTFENDRSVVRAVKIVRKQIKNKSDHENDRLQAEFEREVGVWRYLKHPNILPLIAVYDTNFATFCITKLNSGGTLFDLIRARRKSSLDQKHNGLPAKLAKKYIYQLGSAIRYLHEDVRVVHRDIKPENCLLDMSGPNAATEGGEILLCDFGMADFIHNEHRHVEADDSASANIGPSLTSTNVQGSLEYISPEMIQAGRPMYSTAADMWAFGCVMYTLIAGAMPFTHEFRPRLVLMIQKGAYGRDALRNSLAVEESGRGAVDLVEKCLALDPRERYSIAQALDSEWLRECKALYEPSEFS